MTDQEQRAVDRALTTTRAVRKRLDLDRPVDVRLVREALEVAVQAPSANHAEPWRFVVVTSAKTRAAVGRAYSEAYLALDGARSAAEPGSSTARVRSSSRYLAEVMPHVPVQVACFLDSTFDPAASLSATAKYWASVYPAVWSLQVALRARGLGTCLTTVGLANAPDIAAACEVPDHWTLAALVAVAHSTGREFHPARRQPLDDVVSWR
jgi:nitroreductase